VGGLTRYLPAAAATWARIRTPQTPDERGHAGHDTPATRTHWILTSASVELVCAAAGHRMNTDIVFFVGKRGIDFLSIGLRNVGLTPNITGLARPSRRATKPGRPPRPYAMGVCSMSDVGQGQVHVVVSAFAL
jgi:hypothetical protein